MDALLHTLLYVGIGLAFLIVGTVLFSLSTKMSEKTLILEEGNTAVGLKLAGKMLGLGIVIWAAARYSVSVQDYALWSAFGVVAQIVSYWIVEHIVFPKVSLAKKVEEGNVPVATLLFVVSVSVGLIISGAISYDEVLDFVK